MLHNIYTLYIYIYLERDVIGPCKRLCKATYTLRG